MFISFAVIKEVIFGEIILIVAIIVLTYLISIFFYYKKKYDTEKMNALEIFLLQLLSEQQPFSENKRSHSWKKMPLILPVLHKLDTTVQKDPSWEELKKAIAREDLLPIARKKYKNFRWLTRLLSAQSFQLAQETCDEQAICKLLLDKVPLVHMHAAMATINFPSASTINLMISCMADKRRLGQSMYIKMFEAAPAPVEIQQIIEFRLLNESNAFTRASCYKILTILPTTQTSSLIDLVQNDLQSNNIELKLAALRWIAHAAPEKSLKLLLTSLHDSNWEVRAACARLLGETHQLTVIDELNDCLRDPVWWVRMDAAFALQSLGEKGLAILHQQDPSTDLFAFETAKYILNLPNHTN